MRFTPLRNGCLITFRKCVHETEKNEKFLIENLKSALKKIGFFRISIEGK